MSKQQILADFPQLRRDDLRASREDHHAALADIASRQAAMAPYGRLLLTRIG